MAMGLEDDGLNAWRREQFVWALRWLAAEPEAALAVGREIPICTADEIALDLNHWFEVARDWGLLEPPVAVVIEEIDREFEAMSGQEHAELWTEEALGTSPEWQKQRERARKALELMGEARADAELTSKPGTVYVRCARDPCGFARPLRRSAGG